MSKKYFVADLDGTLIYKQQSYLHPAVEEEEAIKSFIARGNEFMIASGRMYPDIERVMSNLGISAKYVISQNGAYVYKNGKEIRTANLTANQIREMVSLIIDEWKYKPEYISMTTSTFANYMKVYSFKGWGMKRYFKQRKSNTSNILTWKKTTFNKLASKDVKIVRMLVAFRDEQKLQEIEQRLTETFGNQVSVYMSGKYSLEICASGVSKADAIQYIMHMESISDKDIAFIGDSGNDVSVFNVLPYTYVMDHAEKRFKTGSSVEVPRVATAIKDFMKKHEEKNDEE